MQSNGNVAHSNNPHRRKPIDHQIDNIRTLLDEYGVLQGDMFDRIRGYLTGPEADAIQEKIVNYLEAVSPAMGQILKA